MIHAHRIASILVPLTALLATGCLRQHSGPEQPVVPPPPAPTVAPPGMVLIPAGTQVMVRTVEPVSSGTHQTGARFAARLDAAISVHSQVVVPAGTPAYGRITNARKGGKFGRAHIEGGLTDLVINDQPYPFVTNTVGGKSDRQGTAAKVGAGALIGAAAGGGEGAGVGAAIGGGVALVSRNKQITVPEGTLVQLALAQNAVLPAPAGGAPTAVSPAETAPPAAGAAAPTAAAPPVSAGPVAPGTVIPAGTRLMIRLVDPIGSHTHQTGSKFATKLDAAVVVNGQIIAPAGSTAYGRVKEARKGGRVAGKAKLVVELTEIKVGEKLVPIRTNAAGAEGTRQGTVAKVGAGSLIGAAAGGGEGAARGVAVGGALALLTPGKQIQIPKGTLAEFALMQPATVP